MSRAVTTIRRSKWFSCQHIAAYARRDVPASCENKVMRPKWLGLWLVICVD